MATFACHCGTGTVTGTSTANPDPVYTFSCDNHGGAGARDLAETNVTGSPTDNEACMANYETPINDPVHVQWLIDNPAPAKLEFTAID
jgi:hypothetical protein